MIFATALPKIKTFRRPAGLAAATHALLVRLSAASLHHPGRMSASQAASAVRAQARHRAPLTRFPARLHWSNDGLLLRAVADLLLRQEADPKGTWVFVLDQTYCGQQGAKTENTSAAPTTGRGPRSPRAGRPGTRAAPATASSWACC